MKTLKQRKYPYSKIIIYYVFIIGLINAFILASIADVMFDSETLVERPLIFTAFSFFITTSPAFILLAIWLCYKKYAFDQIHDIYSLIKNSLFAFMIYLFFNTIIQWEKIVYSQQVSIFICTSIILFVLLSTFTLSQLLPKTEKYHHQKQHRAKIKQRNKIRHALSPNQDTIPEENLVPESMLKENEVQSFNFSDFFHGYKNKYLNPTTMENNPYPTIKIILSFLILGSVLNAILFTFLCTLLTSVLILFAFLLALTEHGILSSLAFALEIIAYIFAIGILVSALPNLIAGLFLSYNKICLKNKCDYIPAFLVVNIVNIAQLFVYIQSYGAELTAYLVDTFNDLFLIMILCIYSILIGISAIIVSHFTLPKVKQNETNYFQHWSEK